MKVFCGIGRPKGGHNFHFNDSFTRLALFPRSNGEECPQLASMETRASWILSECIAPNVTWYYKLKS